jgi:hypothetical protein
MSLNDIFEYYINNYKNNWYAQDSSYYTSFQAYSHEEKINNEKEINKMIDVILDKFNSWQLESDKKAWAEDLGSFITESISNISIDKDNALKLFINKGMLDITKSFINDCFKNEDLQLEDIGQAIRNAWIMNILQFMLDIKVEYTPSIFGYSMLYPYTDNLIDSDISLEQKENFNKKFYKRLHGADINPSDKQEAEIYHMVELIESQFERAKYPEVYDSLLIIQTSQKDSLIQQTCYCPFEKDIVDISFKKGAASVLADAYLVKGTLTDDEIKFMLGFGIILQLCDDIQDIQSDIDTNSATIFSLSAKGHKLDILANKLFRLIEHVLNYDIKNLKFENSDKVVPFMQQCCNFIALDAIITQKRYFTNEYIKNIEKYLPVSSKFLNNIKVKTTKKFKKIMKKFNDNELKTMIKYINLES